MWCVLPPTGEADQVHVDTAAVEAEGAGEGAACSSGRIPEAGELAADG